MVESSPSRQGRPPCKTNKGMSDEAADAAALTYLLVMRTKDDRDYVLDDEHVAVMFTDDAGRAYIAIGNVEDLAHPNSEVDKNKLDDCAHWNRLEKTHQSRVPIDDVDVLFVLRWYDKVGRNGRILSGYQSSGVVQYHLPLEIKETFKWYSNWQGICPVHLTKMEHQ